MCGMTNTTGSGEAGKSGPTPNTAVKRCTCAEKDAEIEQLKRTVQNWQNRADYAPCPNCLAIEGMGISYNKGRLCLHCRACDYCSPGVEGSPSKEQDRAAIQQWGAKYMEARERFSAALRREEVLREALQGVISAIESAEEVGCIAYTDAWDEAPALWDKPIDVARAALSACDEGVN